MPEIALDFRARDYVTDLGTAVRSLRAFVTIEIGSVRPLCFLDTGAPFSIVSHSVAQRIAWRLLGNALFHQGKPAPLDWQRVPCDFGETDLVVLDPFGTSRTAACRLVGKFAKARHPVLENYVLLGMNFLLDNNLTLTLHGTPEMPQGLLSVP